MARRKTRASKPPTGACPEARVEQDIKNGFRSLYDVLVDGRNIDVSLDATHDIATIYVYCGYDDYLDILDAVYGPGKSPDCGTAIGQSSRGKWKDNKYVTVLTVWINNVRNKDETMSVMVHEMSHVADFILESCNISDENGEARAHIMEAEARRVFGSMYGVNEKTMVDMSKIIESLSEIDATGRGSENGDDDNG